MIIKCEECKSEFNLDESLLKEDGTKVRCSVCKHVFTAFPPEPESLEGPAKDADQNDGLEETVALDSPPYLSETESEISGEDEDDGLDEAIEDALEEDILEDWADEVHDTDAGPEEPAWAGEDDSGTLEEEVDTDAGPEEPAWAWEYDSGTPEEEVDTGLAAPSASPAGGIRSWFKILLVILLIILLFIVGALAVFFLAPDILPDSLSSMKPVKEVDVVDNSIRGLSIKDVSESFLQTSKMGLLFVIKGTVINNNPKSRSFIRLKGAILDNNGMKIRQNLVYAGNTFNDEELEKKDIEEIQRGLKNQAGKGNSNVNVKPGESIPFMIVVENLQNNSSEFKVEPVSSSPGE